MAGAYHPQREELAHHRRDVYAGGRAGAEVT
jgi:hypothetical protein